VDVPGLKVEFCRKEMFEREQVNLQKLFVRCFGRYVAAGTVEVLTYLPTYLVRVCSEKVLAFLWRAQAS
jgi:hypothetical protein